MARYGKLTSQIIALLASGLMLGYLKGKYRKELLRECDRQWHSIDRHRLFSLLYSLKLGKFVELIKEGDNVYRAKLTQKGRRRAQTLKLEEIRLPPAKRWDKKWRLVVFDVPETKRKLRDGLRLHLKRLGLYEFQKSVFVYPYPCESEITLLTNLLGLYQCVRIFEGGVSYDKDLRHKFKL